MSVLDDRLIAFRPLLPPLSDREYVEAVKQIFADEGYMKIAIGGEVRMSGEHWYDKFWTELMQTSAATLAESPELVLDRVKEAAKKASGIK